MSAPLARTNRPTDWIRSRGWATRGRGSASTMGTHNGSRRTWSRSTSAWVTSTSVLWRESDHTTWARSAIEIWSMDLVAGQAVGEVGEHGHLVTRCDQHLPLGHHRVGDGVAVLAEPRHQRDLHTRTPATTSTRRRSTRSAMAAAL